MSRRLLLLLPVLLLSALLSVSVAAGTTKRKPKPVTKVVHVIDDVYTCAGCKGSGTVKAALKVKLNTTLKFSWAAGNQDSHDVNLKSGPKHVKKFHSGLAATDFSYKKKLTKPGTYRIYCSIHTGTMKLLVTVKK